MEIQFDGLSRPLKYTDLIGEQSLAELSSRGFQDNDLSHDQLRRRFEQQRDGILARRINNWQANGEPKKEERLVFGRYTCEIHADAFDKYYEFKVNALRELLEDMSQHEYYRLPNGWLEVYMDCKSQGSSGVVGWNEALQTPHPVLCLGWGMVERSMSAPPIATTLVTQRRFQGSEKMFHARVSIAHELGHIFHQLRSPNHYFAMADLGSFYQQSEQSILGDEGKRRKYEPFRKNNYRPSDMAQFLEKLQRHSQQIGGYCHYSLGNLPHPNEFVAEFFAATKGGNHRFPQHEQLLSVYEALGGPDIL